MPFMHCSSVRAEWNCMRTARLVLCTTFALFAVPAMAADPPAPSDPNKITTLVVYGNDPCPRSNDEEIVVCAREPESERYRIPQRLRHGKHQAAQRSWGDRVQMLEMVGRKGTPNSCSPIGSNGQTGCLAQFLRQAREERDQAALEGSQVP
jgi:hypothetical protein